MGGLAAYAASKGGLDALLRGPKVFAGYWARPGRDPRGVR
jgi:hypothetical protein